MEVLSPGKLSLSSPDPRLADQSSDRRSGNSPWLEDFSVCYDAEAHTVEELVQKLKDPRQVVRIHAATVLGSMGEKAQPAVPALLNLLQTGDIHERKLAAL